MYYIISHYITLHRTKILKIAQLLKTAKTREDIETTKQSLK